MGFIDVFFKRQAILSFVVEGLPTMCKALSLMPGIIKKRWGDKLFADL
jgi:hypothetical protein